MKVILPSRSSLQATNHQVGREKSPIYYYYHHHYLWQQQNSISELFRHSAAV
jgi:hypothetical protein